jgi:DNA-binding Xre family transcriptional regulator
MRRISLVFRENQVRTMLDYKNILGNVRLRNREVKTVEVSYKKLWKILIDKEMKKKDLQSSAGISWASVTKLSKGETVSMEVLMKVCKALECNIGDIMDLIPEDKDTDK